MPSRKFRIHGHAAPKPTVDELLAFRRSLARVSTDFLKIDLATAMNFVKNAQATKDDFRKKRNCRAARRAYEVVAKLNAKVELSPDDKLVVGQRLQELRTELEQLGEMFQGIFVR